MDKTTPLSEALTLVEPGDTLGLGGMTIYRRPVAFVRALIARRPPPGELTLLSFTAGFAADLLVGAGLVQRTRTCYFGLETFGLAPMFTRTASEGKLQIIEESEASIASGLRARMAGVGFMPSTAWRGTDMFAARPDVKTVTDPYSGETLTAFPAIGCDVALIHVLKADRAGNAVLGGNPTIDLQLATVADRVIVTTEELVDELQGPIDIPALMVTNVVSLPRGAWPTSCYPLYPIDGEEILRYIAACNAGNFDEYLATMKIAPASVA
ncbi:MAG TPA: CoA-transferase [Candidatus Sulfomarinibacteraceae bacterium]|nr:CoA-transferase [Candidatus Sulfomarinibacteraceae bacterium]